MFPNFSTVIRVSWTFGINPVFVAFGLSPVSTKSSKTEYLLKLYTIVQLIALSIFFGVLIAFRIQIVEKYDSTGNLNVVLRGASILIAHWIVMADVLRQTSALRKIMQNFKAVDVKIMHCKNYAGIRQDQFKVLVIVVGYVSFVVTSEVLFSTFTTRGEEWWWYWYATIFSLSINRLRHLQNVYLIEELVCRYRAIRLEIESMAESDISIHRVEQVARLSLQLTEKLAEIRADISSVFGLSQLANLTQNFVQLSGDLYWMYGMIYRNQTAMLLGKPLFPM